MDTTQLAIGVFDSGMGGLTVLRALRAALPHERFIYLGDTARLPYGTKSPQTIQQYVVQMARLLVERRIKALVIACNTATTAALSYIQAMLPDLPIVGVVSPGAQAVVRATKNQRILVLATETTIASEAYQRLIAQHLPAASIRVRACSLLVALAEEGMVNNAIAKQALLHYLSEHKDEDTVLLGCTHFPVFKSLLRELLPEYVSLVDSADATVIALQELLSARSLLNLSSIPGHTHYLVTDSVQRFQSVGQIFLDDVLPNEDVELIDSCRGE